MIKMLKAVVMIVLVISFAGCVGDLFFEAQEPSISDEISKDNYQLESSGSIEETIPKQDLKTQEDASVVSQFKVYNISTINNTRVSINDIGQDSELKSNEEILKKSDEKVDSLVNTTKLANQDAALTEKSIQNFQDNNVSTKRIVNESSAEIDDVIDTDELPKESDFSTAESSTDSNIKYIILSRPVIKTPSGFVDLEPIKPEEILSKVNTMDNISVGREVKTINKESNNSQVTIYEGTRMNSSNIEILVSVSRIDDNEVISLAYCDVGTGCRENAMSLVERTDVISR